MFISLDIRTFYVKNITFDLYISHFYKYSWEYIQLHIDRSLQAADIRLFWASPFEPDHRFQHLKGLLNAIWT